MYVENDFLMSLAKNDDWLQDAALDALAEYDGIHTSITAYTEFLVVAYNQEASDYTIDVGRAIGDLVELIPVRPAEHEERVAGERGAERGHVRPSVLPAPAASSTSG